DLELRWTSPSSDKIILGGVDRNTIEPRIERAITSKRRRRSIGLQKGFLRHIHRFGRVSNVPHDQLQDLVLVLDYQQVESRLVTLLNAFDQSEIGCPASRLLGCAGF